jgi:hypothetical protein
VCGEQAALVLIFYGDRLFALHGVRALVLDRSKASTIDCTTAFAPHSALGS